MKTRSILLLTLWLLLAILALTGLVYLTFYGDSTYYVQVDNSRLTEITPRGGMYYRYELPAYDSSGKPRTLSFETSRILRDEAYLCVHVAPLRGVTAWEEIQTTEIPDGAVDKLSVVAP